MPQDYGVGDSLTNVFIASQNPINPTKSALFFAGRKLATNNPIIPPFSNTPMPNLYVPFELPAYTGSQAGLQAVVALGLMGFQYTLGTSFDAVFPAPDIVSTDPVSGLTTLVWNDPLMGIQDLIGQNPTGSVVQATSNAAGSIIGVSIAGEDSYMIISPNTGSALFNDTNTITITAQIVNSKPDPDTSDQACVAAFGFYNQVNSSAIFNSSPNLWLSIFITGRDASISPTATSIALIAPTSAVVQPDGSVNLTYAKTALQLGLLPTSYLGSTTVTQATSAAQGTYHGYVLTSSSCVINVTNVTGTFNTTNTISVVLDITQNGFAHLGEKEIAAYGMGYNIKNYQSGSDYLIDINNVAHTDFYEGVRSLHDPLEVQNNKFNVQGYYSYCAPQINYLPLNQLTAPDNTYFVATTKLDVPTPLQYPANPTILTACSMYDDMNNQYPYLGNEGTSATLAVTVSSDPQTWPSRSSLNQLVSQGFKAIGVNSTKQAYIYRNVCTLQTISGVTDNEFRSEPLQLKVRYLDRNIYRIANQTVIDEDTGMRLNNNPELMLNLKNNVMAFLNINYDSGKGILGNTKNNVTVELNPDDVGRLILTVSTTIVPTNKGVDIKVYVYSYTVSI